MKLTLYNVDKLIQKRTENKQKAYYFNQEFAIIQGKKGIMVTDFYCSFTIHKSADTILNLEVLNADAEPDQIMEDGYINLSIKEIIEEAPKTEIEATEFFHKSNSEKYDKLEKALRKL